MDKISRWATALPALLAVCLFLDGCASDGQTKASIAGADMAVQRARETNAINYAPLELRLAEEKLQRARQTLGKEARLLADEALADARTAEAKSRAAQTAKVEQQVRESVSTLRQEAPPPPAPVPMAR